MLDQSRQEDNTNKEQMRNDDFLQSKQHSTTLLLPLSPFTQPQVIN
jgi:hypothetical protein